MGLIDSLLNNLQIASTSTTPLSRWSLHHFILVIVLFFLANTQRNSFPWRSARFSARQFLLSLSNKFRFSAFRGFVSFPNLLSRSPPPFSRRIPRLVKTFRKTKKIKK